MDIEKILNDRHSIITGKAGIPENKIRSLFERDGHKIINSVPIWKQFSDKYSKYLKAEDKQKIEGSFKLRNNIVHSNYSTILKQQSHIPSKLRYKKIEEDRPVSEQFLEAVNGENTLVDENSNDYGQRFEVLLRKERNKEYNDIFNSAINIIDRVANDSNTPLKKTV